MPSFHQVSVLTQIVACVVMLGAIVEWKWPW